MQNLSEVFDVFPTRVGVDLPESRSPEGAGSFPHTRGGGPFNVYDWCISIRFSPHAWGWTVALDNVATLCYVFPTRVGVDRLRHIVRDKRRCFPHTRGGGPMTNGQMCRGCGFPHTRGGGP